MKEIVLRIKIPTEVQIFRKDKSTEARKVLNPPCGIDPTTFAITKVAEAVSAAGFERAKVEAL